MLFGLPRGVVRICFSVTARYLQSVGVHFVHRRYLIQIIPLDTVVLSRDFIRRKHRLLFFVVRDFRLQRLVRRILQQISVPVPFAYEFFSRFIRRRYFLVRYRAETVPRFLVIVSYVFRRSVHFYRFHFPFVVIRIPDIGVPALQFHKFAATVHFLRTVFFSLFRTLRYRRYRIVVIPSVREFTAVRIYFFLHHVRSVDISVSRLVFTRFVRFRNDFSRFVVFRFLIEFASGIQRIVRERFFHVTLPVVNRFFDRFSACVFFSLHVTFFPYYVPRSVVIILHVRHHRSRGIAFRYGNFFADQSLAIVVRILFRRSSAVLLQRSVSVDPFGNQRSDCIFPRGVIELIDFRRFGFARRKHIRIQRRFVQRRSFRFHRYFFRFVLPHASYPIRFMSILFRFRYQIFIARRIPIRFTIPRAISVRIKIISFRRKVVGYCRRRQRITSRRVIHNLRFYDKLLARRRSVHRNIVRHGIMYKARGTIIRIITIRFQSTF